MDKSFVILFAIFRRIIMEKNNNNDSKVKLNPEILEDMKLDLCDIDINLNNVVASFSLGLRSWVTMDKEKLVMRGRNMEHKWGRHYVRLQLRSPACSANIFPSGKVTITGNKSEDDAKMAARRIARNIQKLTSKYPDIFQQKLVKVKKVKVSMKSFRVTNVWAASQLPWDVKLPLFARQNRQSCYEPELGAAITCQLTSPRACVKIFSSGSLVIQAPVVANIQAAIAQIYPLAHPCRKERKKAKAQTQTKAKKPKDNDQMWRCKGYGGKKKK